MDKETLIRLATPASIFVLALSIISFPIIARADFPSGAFSIYNGALKVVHMNSCS